MPVFLNWLLRLLPTNPICMRLVQGGSKRARHLYIRWGYLGAMILVLLFVLLGAVSSGSIALRDLASSGSHIFNNVSYLQIGLICILTPVFMAGAIAQEANPQTWDILLTTPLNNLQVVLGNLFGRLFFVLALLFSSLPLFAITQYFGGVPGNAIFASYAIAGASALLVASIAVTLSVTRTAGRRAVFVFYISVIMYLFVTAAIDMQPKLSPAVGTSGRMTTIMTPLNPFLALQVLLSSNEYVPRDPVEYADSFWLVKAWFTRPIATFCWLCVWTSLFLVAFSTIRLRVIGARQGSTSLIRRIFRLGAAGAAERQPRHVSHNPIAWRESGARGKTLPAVLARWGFVALGVAVAVTLIILFHTKQLNPTEFQGAVAAVVSAEVVIITLAAINMSATAVSREREDGTLDIILTTPIQPGPYLAGKLRGLIQYLLPMIAVPVITMILIATYVATGGFSANKAVMLSQVALSDAVTKVDLPVVLPEGAIALPIMLAPFVAFCVMIGLQFSVKSKGTIGSVISAVFMVLLVVGLISACAIPSGKSLTVVGGAITGFSPLNLLFSLVYPNVMIPSALESGGVPAGRTSLVIGAMLAAAVYAGLVYGIHGNVKRTFMMNVRKLAGQG